MLKRLFVKLPLYVIFFGLLITGIIPLLYWVITGRDYTDLDEDIEYL